MATSPLFGWEEPDDVDLVKDGAAAIRTLGNAIDTSMGDLLGGTTGQVLSKASNTNMDFTWVTSDDANAIQNTIVDAKGDLIAASAADTPARLAVGANDLLLTAASGEATGLKYTGGWTSFTPTYSGFTVGNATVSAKYNQIGKTVHYTGRITLGSTSSVGGSFVVALPIANNGFETYGWARITDAGTAYLTSAISMGSVNFGFTVLSTSTNYSFQSNVTSTVPMTWTTGDEVNWYITYEAA